MPNPNNQNNPDPIVAYTAQGKPLTQSEYKKDIDDAIEQAKNGEVISQEELDENSRQNDEEGT